VNEMSGGPDSEKKEIRPLKKTGLEWEEEKRKKVRLLVNAGGSALCLELGMVAESKIETESRRYPYSR
jgi:hypothetical protein